MIIDSLVVIAGKIEESSKLCIIILCIAISFDCYLVYFFHHNLLSSLLNNDFNSVGKLLYMVLPFLLFLGVFYYYVLDRVYEIIFNFLKFAYNFVAKKLNNVRRKIDKLFLDKVPESFYQYEASMLQNEIKKICLRELWLFIALTIWLRLDNSILTFFNNTGCFQTFIQSNWDTVIFVIYIVARFCIILCAILIGIILEKKKT